MSFWLSLWDCAHRRWVPGQKGSITFDISRCSRLAIHADSATDTLFDFELRWCLVSGWTLSCCLLGLLVLLALALRVLLHVAILTDSFGVFRLVRAAGGALFPAKLEVTIGTHTFCVVFLISVTALCDDVLLANGRFFSLGAFGAASWPFLANQLCCNFDWRFSCVLQILWARRVANLVQIGKWHSWFGFFNLDRFIMSNFIFIVGLDFIFDKFNFLCLLGASWSSEALVEMIFTLSNFVVEYVESRHHHLPFVAWVFTLSLTVSFLSSGRELIHKAIMIAVILAPGLTLVGDITYTALRRLAKLVRTVPVLYRY